MPKTALREPPQRRAYPINETAVLLGISRSSVYRLINEGELRAIYLGGRRLVPSDEIDRITREGR